MKPKQLLAVDIGNTNITLGLFAGTTLGPCWRLNSDLERSSDEFGLQLIQLLQTIHMQPDDMGGASIASVVPQLGTRWVEVSRRYLNLNPLVVDAGIKTGVKIRYDDPRSVGADRVADAAAAFKLYGGPACIVDFGTATTFDAISTQGEYLGGAIAPGIEVASEALFRRTAKLPHVELKFPPTVIGKNTTHAIQSGLLFGYVGLVQGMVARYRKELGTKMKVIATGGLAPIMAKHATVIDFVAPWLTLEGLRIIYELNKTSVERIAYSVYEENGRKRK